MALTAEDEGAATVTKVVAQLVALPATA